MTLPIDPTFRERWKKTDSHEGHAVWRSVDQVIHGTKVGVHFGLCNGCMKCIEVCPTDVFDAFIHSGSRVADPVKEEDCILCIACELVCPTIAIHVIRSGGSDETLESLLG
jgi:NAD-dependent dihydropyrimidine dehydrogenase PreA subunit